MNVGRWDSAKDGPLDERALAEKLESLGYAVSRYVYPPGTHFPDHTHEVDKIDAVVSGRSRIGLADGAVVLGPGEWIEVPRGAMHNATVVGDEPVVSLDAIRR